MAVSSDLLPAGSPPAGKRMLLGTQVDFRHIEHENKLVYFSVLTKEGPSWDFHSHSLVFPNSVGFFLKLSSKKNKCTCL